MRHLAATGLIAITWACGRPSSAQAPDAAGAPSAGEAGAAAAAAPPPASAPPPLHTEWRGQYASATGTLYIPPDWKTVHWKVDDDGAGVGQGDLVLVVDSTGGRLHGTLSGPLGPATVDGLAADGKVTATLSPDKPGDPGFAGTLQGSVADGTCEGTISASPGLAGAIRTAKFSLRPVGATDAGS